MAAVKRRLVAYDVLGDKRGHVPGWLDYQYTNPLNGLPTLSMTYPYDAPKADLLDDWHEIRFERLQADGSTWEHDFNGCLYLVGFDDDRRDQTKPPVYKYQGIAGLMQYAPIPAAVDDAGDPPDEELGATRPVRKFKDDTPGAVMKKLLDAAQAEGWCPGFVQSAFGGANDTLGTVWPTTLTFEVSLESNPFAVLEMLAAHGYVDWRMNGRILQLYVPDTEMHRDLSTGTEPVVMRHGMGVAEAPLSRTYVELATDVLGIAEDGKVLTDHNPALVLPVGVGQLWRTVNLSGTADPDTAAYALATALQAGREPREQRVRKVNYEWERTLANGTVQTPVQPGLDFRPGDILDVENKKQPDGEIGRAPMRVVEYKINEGSGTGQSGWVTLNDRQETHAAKMLRNLAQLTAGTAGGQLGALRIPGDDPRVPDITAAPAPTLTKTTIADHGNRPRGQLEITQLWDSSVPALDPDGEVSATPIRVEEWVYAARRPARKWKEVLRARADDTSNIARVEQLWDPDETIQLRRAAVSHAGKISAWVDLTDATWVADTDASLSADLVLDSNHRNAAIRANRAAAAGAGFAFELISSQYVAAFTTTAPILDYGWGGKADSGRRQCRVGDVVVVDCEGARPAGTSVTLRVQIRWYLEDGTTSSTTVISQAITSGSYALFSGTATAPALAAGFAVRVDCTAMSGLSPKLRVRKVNTFRRVDEPRMGDLAASNRTVVTDAVDARTIHPTDQLTSKHTSTAALFQAAAGSSGWKGGTAGLYFYDGAGLAFEATSAGVYIRGSLEAGGIFIDDDVIDFGGGIGTITYDAGGLIYDADFHDFAAPVGFRITGGFQVVGDSRLDEVGFNGNAAIGKITLHNTLTDVQRIAALEALAASFGLAVVVA